MDKQERIELIRNIVDQVNSEFNYNIIVMASIQSQWQRGNGTIKRTDRNDISTLAINIRTGGCLVGCDNEKRGINEYLEKNFPLNNKNDQNIRFKVDDSNIYRVIEYYANLK